MDRVHDVQVHFRESRPHLVQDVALGHEDLPFQYEDPAVVHGGHAGDTEDVGTCAFRRLRGLAGLIKEAVRGFSVGAERLQAENPGEEGVLGQRGLGHRPEQAGGVVEGEGLETAVGGDGLHGKVARDLEGLSGGTAGKVVFADFLVSFRRYIERPQGGDIGDAFVVAVLVGRDDSARRRPHRHVAYIAGIVDGNGEMQDAAAFLVVVHDGVVITREPSDAGVLAVFNVRQRGAGEDLSGQAGRGGLRCDDGRVPAVCRAGAEGLPLQARGPDATVLRRCDGGGRTDPSRRLRLPDDQRSGSGNGHGKVHDFAPHRHQQDMVDARVGGQSFQLYPHEGAGVAHGEERVAVLGEGRVRLDRVLLE